MYVEHDIFDGVGPILLFMVLFGFAGLILLADFIDTSIGKWGRKRKMKD